jgi:tRNA G18 (ribose-2'-O)-methylase SpoU
MDEAVLILHNIRSAHNVGSMFRTADAAGVGRIILSGYTPGPVDPHGKVRKEFIKVSLGAEEYVPWERVKTFAQAAKKLKKEGCEIVAIEQHKNSTPLFAYKPPKDKPLAVVMGNEVRGLSKQSLSYCDAVVEIPMKGKKESLNVSVACGVALFTLTR